MRVSGGWGGGAVSTLVCFIQENLHKGCIYNKKKINSYLSSSVISRICSQTETQQIWRQKQFKFAPAALTPAVHLWGNNYRISHKIISAVVVAAAAAAVFSISQNLEVNVLQHASSTGKVAVVPSSSTVAAAIQHTKLSNLLLSFLCHAA